MQNAGIITIAKIEDLTEAEWDANDGGQHQGRFPVLQEAIRRMRKSTRAEG